MAFNYSPRIVTDGLVLYLDAANRDSYPGSGTVWNDISRGGNNGTLTNGPTFNSGNGGSIVFDGSNDYVITSDNQSTSLNITAGITLESWIRPTALANASNGDGVFSKGLSSDNNSGAYELLLYPSSSFNTPLFRIRVGSSTPTYNPNTPLTVNQIYHLISTYDGTTIRIFINGVESGNGLNQVGGIESNTQQLTIGVRYLIRNFPSFDSFFTGNIYLTRIYNRALSPQEILQNYNATKTRFNLT